jgi:hypothetical protein
MHTKPRGLYLLILLAVAFVVGAGFIVVILGNFGGGIALHELAASLLLALLLLALWAAYPLRRIDGRPSILIVASLTGLIVAAAIGSLLSSSAGSGVPTGLPLVPLGVMLAAMAEGIRVTYGLVRRREITAPELA